MRGRGVRTLPLLAALLVLSSAARANVQQIASDASVHRVEAVSVGKPAMPALRHTVLRRDGSSDIVLVPGTGDAWVDTEPALAIDPVTGDPVVVWSRDEGAGFDIWISRYHAGIWSAPVRILDGGADEVRPQIQVTDSLIHVAARSGETYQRLSLDRATLQPAFGPEPLPTGGPGTVPGGSGTAVSPPTDHVFFASDVIPPTEGDAGRIVIWGVRDEPVPIDYVEVLLVPVELAETATPLVSPIEGSLTVTVSAPDRIWYTLWLEESWQQFGAVDRSPETSLSDVRLMLADMIRRQAE